MLCISEHWHDASGLDRVTLSDFDPACGYKRMRMNQGSAACFVFTDIDVC